MLSPVKNACGRLSEALAAGPRTGSKKSNISAPYVTPRSGRRLALRTNRLASLPDGRHARQGETFRTKLEQTKSRGRHHHACR